MACGIEFDDYIIVTGGRYSMTTVSLYNKDGFDEYLPSLNTARYKHACSHYVNKNFKLVSFIMRIRTSKTMQ